jgi:imidazolonepropionase-like amidohydrolase
MHHERNKEIDMIGSNTERTVIRGVTVVSTRDGSLSPGMDLFLEHNRIERIGRAGIIEIEKGTRIVEASGKYVVPGYLDMHAHAMFSDAVQASGGGSNAGFNPSFNLMIANGITGFREMAGSGGLLAEKKTLLEQIEAGTAIAPEPLIMAGEVVNIFSGQGLSFFKESGAAAASPAERARAGVQRQKGYGAEFIKIVYVDREAFFAVVDAATRAGLYVAGHLNPVVSAREASDAGMRAIEHLGPILAVLVDCSFMEKTIRKKLTAPTSAPVLPGPPTPEMIRRIVANPTMLAWERPGVGTGMRFVVRTFSKRKARSLARTFVANGTWHVPTLIRSRTMQISDDPAYGGDPNLKYVSPETRAMWAELTDGFRKKAPEKTRAAFRELYGAQVRLVKILKEEGVKMLAGSDMTGIYCIPGFSLHQEFAELSKAGLSPLEILQMTTLDAAGFLGREATMGAVEEGKNADLVLLDANPLESVENLCRIHGVVLKGQYFPGPELERMKDDVEAFYAKSGS